MSATAMVKTSTVTRDLLTGGEWDAAGLRELYHLAADVKSHQERYRSALVGQSVVMIFEKPSLRTRVTFEVGIRNLGGNPIFLDHAQSRMGEREDIMDVARNLERWVHGIVARVFEQRVLEELAAHASIPVINALSDRFHPCQALADFFTLEERFGSLRGFEMAYVGDGNNTCHSLMMVAARLGVHLRVATPSSYKPDAQIVADARRTAAETRGSIDLFTAPADAARNARAVYTDIWASMGQEDEASERELVFRCYQVNEALMALASPDAVFMHCLPAHRGLEVTAPVIDSERSVVYEQAQNRLHVQNAVMLTLLD